MDPPFLEVRELHGVDEMEEEGEGPVEEDGDEEGEMFVCHETGEEGGAWDVI